MSAHISSHVWPQWESNPIPWQCYGHALPNWATQDTTLFVLWTNNALLNNGPGIHTQLAWGINSKASVIYLNWIPLCLTWRGFCVDEDEVEMWLLNSGGSGLAFVLLENTKHPRPSVPAASPHLPLYVCVVLCVFCVFSVCSAGHGVMPVQSHLKIGCTQCHPDDWSINLSAKHHPHAAIHASWFLTIQYKSQTTVIYIVTCMIVFQSFYGSPL